MIWPSCERISVVQVWQILNKKLKYEYNPGNFVIIHTGTDLYIVSTVSLWRIWDYHFLINENSCQVSLYERNELSNSIQIWMRGIWHLHVGKDWKEDVVEKDGGIEVWEGMVGLDIARDLYLMEWTSGRTLGRSGMSLWLSLVRWLKYWGPWTDVWKYWDPCSHTRMHGRLYIFL